MDNNFYFIFPDGTPCTTENITFFFSEVVRANTFEPGYKITQYSARIGLATMMIQRGLKEANVYDYGAWTKPTSKAAMFGYVRMSMEEKIKLPRFICGAPVLFDDIIFSPADFNSNNMSF